MKSGARFVLQAAVSNQVVLVGGVSRCEDGRIEHWDEIRCLLTWLGEQYRVNACWSGAEQNERAIRDEAMERGHRIRLVIICGLVAVILLLAWFTFRIQ